MRRAPRQARGQQRVDAILDAAAALFAEVGYETATTNAIAARAGVPIGSVYQFFPNKAAVLHRLALRYLDELRALYAAELGEQALQLPPETAIGRLIDAFVAFHHQRPGFAAVFGGAPLSAEVAGATEALHAELVGRVEAMLNAFVPMLPQASRPLAANMCVHLVKGVMPLLHSAPVEALPSIAGELKQALLGYLESLRRRVEADAALRST